PVARERLTTSLAEALSAARELSYPVALKVVSDDIAHKTDLGLVALALGDETALENAWESLARRIAPSAPRARLAGMGGQGMVPGGVEVSAGVSRDPECGHMLAFGVGGAAMEILKAFALRPLPLREGDAFAMVSEVRGASLLEARRGRPAADVESLV